MQPTSQNLSSSAPIGSARIGSAAIGSAKYHLAVVLPCYRTRNQVLAVIDAIGAEVQTIIAVDDACPEGTGAYLQEHCTDPRLQVVFHAQNQGVGAAVLTGWKLAALTTADILIKLDSDGQMDPRRIRRLVSGICSGKADYCKGNRFFSRDGLHGMPKLRLLGNAGLSLLNKISSGYWQIMDPNNGFVAIHARVFRQLNTRRMAHRYFFESDLLHSLGMVRARVMDVPIPARYRGEPSSMSPLREIGPFFKGHVRNTLRRLLHSYLLRGVSLASIELVLGLPLLIFGLIMGICTWWQSSVSGQLASAGTVMLAALPTMVGIQLVLSWLNYDVLAEPRDAVWPMLVDEEADQPQALD